MVNRKELYLILLVLIFLMFLLSCLYYLACNQGGCLHHLKILTDLITILIVKIKNLIVKINNLIKNVWFEFKRKMDDYLNVVYKLAMLASAKFIIGDADIWKVCWIASIATFAIFCCCLKICVERKRAELTQTTQNVTPRNNGKVWFVTLMYVLEVLLPLSYLRLAFAYFIELDLKNHPTKKYWKMAASAFKICIIILTVLIPVMDIYRICNTTQEAENQSDADANRPEVALQMVAENHSVADAEPPGLALQIHDLENQSYAHANRPEVPLQMDAVNHSVAYPIGSTENEYLVPVVSFYAAQ